MHLSSLKILWEDKHLVAIDKPSQIAVHPSELHPKREKTVLKLLKMQLGGHYLYPIHRLDYGVSGVLLFAKSKEAAGGMGKLLQDHQIEKIYEAIVRGVFVKKTGVLEKELENKTPGVLVPARTEYETLGFSDVNTKIGKSPHSMISWLRANPKTGRFHQIRRHFKHESHPILGDRIHGDGAWNRWMREQIEESRIMLHSTEFSFVHPITLEKIKISSPVPESFLKFRNHFQWQALEKKI